MKTLKDFIGQELKTKNFDVTIIPRKIVGDLVWCERSDGVGMMYNMNGTLWENMNIDIPRDIPEKRILTYKQACEYFDAICWDCAKEYGARESGDACTMSEGVCSCCGETKGLPSIGDYIWFGENKVPGGRWD